MYTCIKNIFVVNAIPFKNFPDPPIQKMAFSRPPYTKKWDFWDPPIQTKWPFRDPHIQKMAFSRPPYSKKFNPIQKMAVIWPPPYKNAKIWPPDTHIFYPLYNFLPPIQNDIFETPYTKNGIFETPHNKKLYFWDPRIQQNGSFETPIY